MNPHRVWWIIELSKDNSCCDQVLQAKWLEDYLGDLTPVEIIAFDDQFRDLRVRLERSAGLQAAFTIMSGGFSDDAFSDFCKWIISLGKVVYENALANPDCLAELKVRDLEEFCFESFSYATQKAFEQKVGKALHEVNYAEFGYEPGAESEHEDLPKAEPEWETLDEAIAIVPRLTAKYRSLET